MKTYLGTWQIAPSDGFWTDQDLSESEVVLSAAVKAGIRCFDTAQSYGKGRSEQTLAKILRRHPDIRFTIDTKIMPSTKSPEDNLRISLDRLKPFSVDCLYLHWPRSGFDNLAYLKEMEKLRGCGIIRKLGICNLPLQELERFIRVGLKIDRIQRPVSLLWSRDIEETQTLEVNVYPNPAQSTVFVEGEGIGTVALYDMFGTCLRSMDYSLGKNLDVSDLPQGIFVLVLTTQDGRTIYKKLMVE